MTATTHRNIAQDDATVGVQAEVVHGDITVYQLAPDAPAEDWFRKGVWYLDARIPAQALHHIEAAITRGYETEDDIERRRADSRLAEVTATVRDLIG
ncbi:hypothetical protein ACQP1P_24245 [Dactylosporangium sp. CA-052675]|uniref:hypothetical protein n=1 Tax=Dactylosporangium sp. CA-052675 TaxID=3239927 RepID=UPI003D94A2CA